MVKASHLLRYSQLKQLEAETGAEYIYQENKEFTTMLEMGVNAVTLYVRQNLFNRTPQIQSTDRLLKHCSQLRI
jgi:hypothetical protein